MLYTQLPVVQLRSEHGLGVGGLWPGAVGGAAHERPAGGGGGLTKLKVCVLVAAAGWFEVEGCRDGGAVDGRVGGGDRRALAGGGGTSGGGGAFGCALGGGGSVDGGAGFWVAKCGWRQLAQGPQR